MPLITKSSIRQLSGNASNRDCKYCRLAAETWLATLNSDSSDEVSLCWTTATLCTSVARLNRYSSSLIDVDTTMTGKVSPFAMIGIEIYCVHTESQDNSERLSNDARVVFTSFSMVLFTGCSGLPTTPCSSNKYSDST